MKRTICVLSLELILLSSVPQEVNAGINKWWSLIPVFAAYSIWSMRNPESHPFFSPFRPFIPESILRELNEPMAWDLPAPPRSDDLEVQGGWAGSNIVDWKELVIDCRSDTPETCSVYWNCPSCYDSFENQEWYQGQAKTKLGEVKRTLKFEGSDGHVEEQYKGIIYNPEKFIEGQLEKVETIMYLKGHVETLKVSCWNPATGEKVFYIRCHRTSWHKEIARIFDKHAHDIVCPSAVNKISGLIPELKEQWNETSNYVITTAIGRLHRRHESR